MPGPNRFIDLAQILAILRAVAGQLEFRAVIQAASSVVRDLVPHDHLDVALLNPDHDTVTAYETGLHTEWDASTTATKPVDVSPIRDLFTSTVDHIVTDDAQTDPRFHFDGAFSTPIFAAGLHSRLHVGLKVEGRLIGALSFSTQEIGSYGATHLENARIVADILSSYIFALQQGELAKERELRQVEAEARAEGLRIGALRLTEELEYARQAIGMDLHDQTLADLTRIARHLKRLGGRAALRGDELQPLQEDVDHCVRELRVIIDDAKPSVLQLFGFCQAVESLLERSVGAATPPIGFRLVEDGSAHVDELPQAIVVALYRIVQEAVNNALRHAEASRIEVRLWKDEEDDRVRIVVEDDGCGLPKSGGRRMGGLGNMRTRASLIRAELKTGPGTGGVGTRLELILPEDAAASDPRRAPER